MEGNRFLNALPLIALGVCALAIVIVLIRML